tara:strand:+ start:408 stop:521 length:114 start_codon:yes stop_codon:yes gene_type:complete
MNIQEFNMGLFGILFTGFPNPGTTFRSFAQISSMQLF